MNRELELLVLAYDALLQASGDQSQAAIAAFDAKLDEALQRTSESLTRNPGQK